MSKNTISKTINDLFERCEWEQARRLLEKEREQDPNNHWVLTQLGVTFYEQKKYEEALKLLLASLKIVGDCPLTLWNLAGTLDALGNYTDAMQIYTWLLESDKTASEDPCWESKAWADSLKTDSVYRMGVCFQHLGKKTKAEHCYQQYLNLLLSGAEGVYSIEDVTRRIRSLRGDGKSGISPSKFRKAVNGTLLISGRKRSKRRSTPPPKFDEAQFLSGRHVASKH
jgi:tetratricopeptide (TPR) repeat protein